MKGTGREKEEIEIERAATMGQREEKCEAFKRECI